MPDMLSALHHAGLITQEQISREIHERRLKAHQDRLTKSRPKRRQRYIEALRDKVAEITSFLEEKERDPETTAHWRIERGRAIAELATMRGGK